MSDVSKTNEALIAEAQEHYSEMNGLNSRAAEVMMELVAALEAKTGARVDMSSAIGVETQLAATRVPVQEEGEVTGNTSDGYHTFDELYEYRMLYNAHASHGWLAAGVPVVKSWKHSDGELCFGGGWFIVTATLPAGQVSNHYKAEHWGLFKVPEVELPPAYDGHTPKAAADRLRIEAEHARAVQGEPNDELIAEARKAERAVYLATEEAVAKDISRIIKGLADALEAATRERAAATAVVERVRALHVPDEYGLCVECSWEYPETSYDAIGNEVEWPCSTVAALDGAPEPEWEEVVQYGNLTSAGFLQEIRGRNYAMHKRVVRFGPVLPAQGESDE